MGYFHTGRGLFLTAGLILSIGFSPNVSHAQAVTNLIQNPSFEAAAGSLPASWSQSYWGTPNPSFSYSATAHTGSKGATITFAADSTGDANWFPADSSVTPGASYTYSVWYNSNVATEIDVAYTNAGGAVSYYWLADVPSSAGAWNQISAPIVIPAGMTKANVFQLIYLKGTLTIDDVSFTADVPPPAQPTLSFSASPTSIVTGSNSTLSWTSTNATSCTASNGWTGVVALSGTQTISPVATTTFVLSCTGTGGSVSNQVIVNVLPVTPPPLKPAVTFTATPTSIIQGQSSSLVWSSQNATSCTGSNGWIGALALAGSQTVSPTITTTYVLTCAGAGGSVSSQATVTVNILPPPPKPTVTISASLTSISQGQSTVISWSSQNSTSCTASGAWSGAQAISGSLSVSPIITSAYTISCAGAGGSSTASVPVTVIVPTPGVFTQGMVTLSFDDAWASQYTNALPVLQKSGLPATFYLISDVIRNNSNFPGYMTPGMATTIANLGYEIADHTISHPDLVTLTNAQINNEIIGSRTYLQNLTGKAVTTIAYPYGSVNAKVKNLTAAAGYAAGRGVDDSQLNTGTSDKYNLFSQCIENTTSLASIKSWIDRAKANKQWYILCFHQIGSTPDQFNIPTSEFQQILDYIKSTGIRTVTVAQGRALMAP